MKLHKTDQIQYTNDMIVKEVKYDFTIIFKYVALFFWWHFTLSFQENFFYNLMNIEVLFMLLGTCVGVVICKEEKETILKNFKNNLFYYLTIIFVYDMTILLAVQNAAASTAASAAAITAKSWLTYMSVIVKVAYPIAYIVWIIQKLAIFKNHISKFEQMKVLRNVKENQGVKLENANKNYSERY